MKPDFLAIFAALARHDVRFIVVGGVCGVLHGAPVTTFDLDLVHARDQENAGRLSAALTDLDAFYRTHPEQRLRPTAEYLMSPGHHLLLTSAGPLDLLGTVGEGQGYGELLKDSSAIEIASVRVEVLGLETLIRLKEELGREKDRAVLAILKRTLEESRKR